MNESELYKQLLKKDLDLKRIKNKITKEPELIPLLFTGFKSNKAILKYRCLKLVRLISEESPDLIYPYIKKLIGLLDSENNIMKWGAIIIISNLAAVDKDNVIEKNFNKYFNPIKGPVMITAANVISSSSKIALAKPGLTDKISNEILKVEYAEYQTDECKNIAYGHAIKSFYVFFDKIKNKKPVVLFVKNQLNNSRDATKNKAEKFLNKYKIENY
ncbi:hypothetical protein ACFLS9_04220 [Bacteroidota bacterium]